MQIGHRCLSFCSLSGGLCLRAAFKIRLSPLAPTWLHWLDFLDCLSTSTDLRVITGPCLKPVTFLNLICSCLCAVVLSFILVRPLPLPALCWSPAPFGYQKCLFSLLLGSHRGSFQGFQWEDLGQCWEHLELYSLINKSKTLLYNIHKENDHYPTCARQYLFSYGYTYTKNSCSPAKTCWISQKIIVR